MKCRLSTKLLTLCGTVFLRSASAQEAGVVFIRQEIPHVASLIVTKGTLGDKQCSFIIDTGSEFTVLDQSLLGLLKNGVANGVYEDGSGRTPPVRFFQAPPMKFHSLEIQKPIVAVLDIRPLSKYLDRSVNGVMGINHLGATVLSVNNDSALLEIHSSPWKLTDGPFTEVELLDYLASPTFETSIAGRYGQFLVDTGNLGNISLERSLFTALVRNGSIEVSESKAHTLGVSGTVDVRSGWFLKGELMRKSLIGMAVNETLGKSAIGIQWLYGFNYELDSKLHRFRYKQRVAAPPPASPYLMLGAILIFGETGAEVERLNQEPNGAAQAAGINPGDVIETLDFLKASDMNYASVTELLMKKKGHSIQVQFIRKSDGARLQATLRIPPLISPWNFGGRDLPKGNAAN